MASIYQNKEFANFWNTRVGEEGEPYKLYVLDPIMLKKLGSLKNKVIFELGCGNGYLIKKFLKQNPKKLILSDISKHNLAFASERTTDKRVSFLRHDATQKWEVTSNSVDILYSNMMLNEVKNIKTPIREASRILRKGGQCMISVTHPAWDLFVYAQELAGKPSAKIKNLGNYFRRGYTSFLMGANEKNNIKGYSVEHFQRPISDYLNTFIAAGFSIKEVIEPPLTTSLLRKHPRFAEFKHHPVGLIFWCQKK